MRQYGAPAGNPWESEREFVAAKARAIEGRVAAEVIGDGVEAFREVDGYADLWCWGSDSKPCGMIGCPSCFCPLGCCAL